MRTLLHKWVVEPRHRRAVNRIIAECQNAEITVQHNERMLFDEAGSNTLGEFLGIGSVYIAKATTGYRGSAADGYTWDLDQRGKLMHGMIWRMKDFGEAGTIPIRVPRDQWSAIEEIAQQQFVLAKMET